MANLGETRWRCLTAVRREEPLASFRTPFASPNAEALSRLTAARPDYVRQFLKNSGGDPQALSAFWRVGRLAYPETWLLGHLAGDDTPPGKEVIDYFMRSAGDLLFSADRDKEKRAVYRSLIRDAVGNYRFEEPAFWALGLMPHLPWLDDSAWHADLPERFSLICVLSAIRAGVPPPRLVERWGRIFPPMSDEMGRRGAVHLEAVLSKVERFHFGKEFSDPISEFLDPDRTTSEGVEEWVCTVADHRDLLFATIPVGTEATFETLSLFFDQLMKKIGWRGRSGVQPTFLGAAQENLILPADSPHRSNRRATLLLETEPYHRLYEAMLAAHDRGPDFYRKFLSDLPMNQTVRERMKGLEIDLATWEEGLPDRHFVIGEQTDVKEAPEGFLEPQFIVLRQAYQDLTAALHHPDRLYQSLLREVSEFRRPWDAPAGFENYRQLLAFLQDRREPDPIRRVLASTAQWADRPQNRRPSEAADLALFHIRRVQRLLKGGGRGETLPALVRIGLARKDPLTDLTIGNDSGCCIGVFIVGDDEQQLSNGVYMPFYLADLATQFIAIHLGARRRGLGLLFAGETDEESSELVVNSVELSESLGDAPEHLLKGLARKALTYANDYAVASGFNGSVVSTHGYNTGYNYARDMVRGSPQFAHIAKIHGGGPFYSDVFSESDSAPTASSEGLQVIAKRENLRQVDPERYLMSSSLKRFEPDSLAKRIVDAQWTALLVNHLYAYRFLEDKPVEPEYVVAFSRALTGRFPLRSDQLRFCLKLLELTWEEAKAKIDELIA